MFDQLQDYLNLEMKWIDHHNPDLVVINENGNPAERIDLSPYKYDEIIQLLEQKGFMKA